MESKDYHYLKNRLALPGVDRMDRVESTIIAGMPDVNYCIDGMEGWIEMKSPTEPKRQTTKLFGSNHKLSQSQMNWFKRQVRAGGGCFVLIVTDKRWLLINGKYADFINDMTVDQLILISDWYEKKPVDKKLWKNLRGVLGGQKILS